MDFRAIKETVGQALDTAGVAAIVVGALVAALRGSGTPAGRVPAAPTGPTATRPVAPAVATYFGKTT